VLAGVFWLNTDRSGRQRRPLRLDQKVLSKPNAEKHPAPLAANPGRQLFKTAFEITDCILDKHSAPR